MDAPTALRQCPLFHGLDDAVRAKLAALCEEKAMEAGTILFCEGEPATELYVITEGTIEVVKGHREDGGGKLLSRIAPPASLGEAALYGDRPRSATAIARDNAKVLRLTRDAFQRFAQDDPHSAQQIFVSASRVLFERLEHTSQELSAVFDLGKLLGRAPALPELTREVVERLRLFVPQAEQVCFHLWNLFSEEFEPASAWPDGSQAVAHTRQSPLVRDFDAGKQTIVSETAPGNFVLASALVSEGKVIGFISLTRRGAPFGNEHRNLVEAVCGMMVSAVVSAWAREEERARQRLLQAKQRV